MMSKSRQRSTFAAISCFPNPKLRNLKDLDLISFCLARASAALPRELENPRHSLVADGFERSGLTQSEHWRVGYSHSTQSRAPLFLFFDRAANHLNPKTVIRCLTIAIQDAAVLNIVLELTMPGRPPRHFNKHIKQPMASSFSGEARPC
jgi:hypothetical protein